MPCDTRSASALLVGEQPLLNLKKKLVVDDPQFLGLDDNDVFRTPFYLSVIISL